MQGMNDDMTRFTTLSGHKRCIQAANDCLVNCGCRLPPRPGAFQIKSQIKPWGAGEIKPRQIMPCSKNPANGKFMPNNLMQAGQQHLWRTWSPGSVGVSLCDTGLCGVGDEFEPFIARKRPEFHPPVRVAQQPRFQSFQRNRQGRIAEACLCANILECQRSGFPKPVNHEHFQDIAKRL